MLLFSGHRVDAPGRAAPRLPNEPAALARAARAIGEVLDGLDAGPSDLALTQGANGGDLLFTAEALARGVDVRWLQPLDEAAFIAASVAPAGDAALRAYASLRTQLSQPPRALPAILGHPVDATADPWRRGNRWLIDTARAYGLSKLQCICLWDFERPDNEGGTAAMIEDARHCTSRIFLIDCRALS